MLSQQVLEGNWNQIKGKVREKWGQLTDDDLENFRGKGEQLVGAIQRKTGEAREQIERFLNQAAEQGSSASARATETAKQYAQQATEEFHRASEQVGESFRKGYEQAEAMIEDRPVQSVAFAFGMGLVAGTILGLILRSGNHR